MPRTREEEQEIENAFRDALTSLFVDEKTMQEIASKSDQNKMARQREMPKQQGTALNEAYRQVQGRNMMGMRASAYDRGASAVNGAKPTGRRIVVHEEFEYDHPDDSDQLGY